MRTDTLAPRTGYLAAALLILHAALSVYWAAGGTALLSLLSEGIREQADLREPWFIAMVWGVAVVKFAVALIVLAVARRRFGMVPQWMHLLVVWGAGIVLTLYGTFNMLTGTAALAGILSGPEELGREFWAYLLFWWPWWLAIGLTCLMTAWLNTARQSPVQASHPSIEQYEQ